MCRLRVAGRFFFCARCGTVREEVCQSGVIVEIRYHYLDGDTLSLEVIEQAKVMLQPEPTQLMLF